MRRSHFSNVVGTGDWSADILVRLCVRVNPQAHRRGAAEVRRCGDPKTETRNPKEIREPKPEIRKPRAQVLWATSGAAILIMAMSAQIRNPKEIQEPKADSASSRFNAEAQRGQAATKTKSGLTQRHSAAKPQPRQNWA